MGAQAKNAMTAPSAARPSVRSSPLRSPAWPPRTAETARADMSDPTVQNLLLPGGTRLVQRLPAPRLPHHSALAYKRLTVASAGYGCPRGPLPAELPPRFFTMKSLCSRRPTDPVARECAHRQVTSAKSGTSRPTSPELDATVGPTPSRGEPGPPSCLTAGLLGQSISVLCFGRILGELARENRQETAEIGSDLHAYAAFYKVRAIDH